MTSEEKKMNIQERLQLIREVAEEIVGESELVTLLDSGKEIVAYDGFEPSGKIHIAQGLMRAINVNKLVAAGIRFKFWVADWFAMMNKKMGGDLNKIQVLGEYFIEVWKACGMSTRNVEFLFASQHMNQEYWLKVLRIGGLNSVTRIRRCADIMGRTEKDELSASQIFYPCMQCADIFHLDVDIAQLGMDQRKVNMLAREVASELSSRPPIAIHHHMLIGLGKPPKDKLTPTEKAQFKKMSKSNPKSSIFMTDSVEEVDNKIRDAFCVDGVIVDNPMLEYCKFIIFERKWLGFDTCEMKIDNIVFSEYCQLEAAFVRGEVSSQRLKIAVAHYINEMLEPVRQHFCRNEDARLLLETIQKF